MARVTLTSKVRGLNAQSVSLIEALMRVTDGATGELVAQLSGIAARIDEVCGLDRIDRGLPFEEDETKSQTVFDESLQELKSRSMPPAGTRQAAS